MARRGDAALVLALYSPSRYSGDEDNGSMSSWFLLSAMGLYQLVPASTTYSIGSPLYRRLRLVLDNGKELVIEAPGNSAETPYVHAVSFNKVPLAELQVDYWRLRAGGTLTFTMGSKPCAAFPCKLAREDAGASPLLPAGTNI